MSELRIVIEINLATCNNHGFWKLVAGRENLATFIEVGLTTGSKVVAKLLANPRPRSNDERPFGTYRIRRDRD